MTRRVAFVHLPRNPRGVRLLHHARGGTLIAAIRYAPTSPSSASSLYFTVVEVAAPNEEALPPRVLHVRVPRPASEVSALTLLRSADGADVFVVVQAAAFMHPSGQLRSTTIYVYRRQLLDEESENDASEDEHSVDADDGVISSPASPQRPTSKTRVQYQRLPHSLTSTDGGGLWTAVAAFYPAENLLAGVPSLASTVGAPTATFITASGWSLRNADEGANRLRLWSLRGTRVALEATCELPALTGFPVEEILTLPGTEDVVLLRHHNSIIEVNLAALRSACAQQREPDLVVFGNAFLSQAWRCTPHARLTACAVKDAFVYAASEDGTVLVWDLRAPTTTAATGPCIGPPPQRSASLKSPITGLHAPYATGFITCDASGGVRDWRERGEAGPAGMEENEEDEGAYSRGAARRGNSALCDVAGMAAATAIAAASQFPYRLSPPVEAPTGGESCVAMDGQDNFVSVVREGGTLGLYLCE